MNKALFIFAFVLATQTVSAFEWWNDLRVTWGPLPTIGYDHLPRNIVDAVKEGWVLTSTSCDNEGYFAGNRYIYPDNMGAAVLFDSIGNAAGVQALFPQSTAAVPGSTYRFDLVPMIQNETIADVDYFVITVYFIEPAGICNATKGSSAIGANSQVYFQNGADLTSMKIAPKQRGEAIDAGWTKNQCIPGMGWHNFFEVEKYDETNCADFQPTCILYDDFDQMHGFCLIMGGNATSTRFEHPDTNGIKLSLGADVAPVCLLEQTELIGATTIHFYFTNTPWNYNCQ